MAEAASGSRTPPGTVPEDFQRTPPVGGQHGAGTEGDGTGEKDELLAAFNELKVRLPRLWEQLRTVVQTQAEYTKEVTKAQVIIAAMKAVIGLHVWILVGVAWAFFLVGLWMIINMLIPYGFAAPLIISALHLIIIGALVMYMGALKI